MFEPLTNHFLIAPLLVLLSIALITDTRDRRISNLLVVAGLAVGVAGHTWFSGTAGFLMAAIGACVGLLCLLPLYISGGMGAGDVKLMALCGAFLGPVHVVVAAVSTLIIGGVLGSIWFFLRLTSTGPDHRQDDADSVSLDSAIPYALAIAAGAVTALIVAPAISQALG
ncbi:MAG: prepilin peptidase [Pseudomonadota bacterium]